MSTSTKPGPRDPCEACDALPSGATDRTNGHRPVVVGRERLVLCPRCRRWLAEAFVQPGSRAEAIDRLQKRAADLRTQIGLCEETAP